MMRREEKRWAFGSPKRVTRKAVGTMNLCPPYALRSAGPLLGSKILWEWEGKRITPVPPLGPLSPSSAFILHVLKFLCIEKLFLCQRGAKEFAAFVDL